MAFFSGLSSSIGKKLLLYGLRHIDILDKDPTDFVSVDVGKRTTLEVRDVGLHVKKLIALLHLKLPPEIHLSKAQASLLRVTFVLDFGVPQISIVVNGIQIQARLEDCETESEQAASSDLSSPQRRPSTGQSPASSPARDRRTDYQSSDNEHVPTVDELAYSFMRTEPVDEIRELEQELESRSEYLHESISSDGDDDMAAGMGAPLALPNYLRNILNTALDRLSLAVHDIDIEVEDYGAKPETSGLGQGSPVSINFHVDGIAIDSTASQDIPADHVSPSKPENTGKRRMRIENICASLLSDAENFVSMSKISRPESPITTRSEMSSSQQVPLQPPDSQENEETREEDGADEELEPRQRTPVPLEPSITSLPAPGQGLEEHVQDVDNVYDAPDALTPSIEYTQLAESRRTIDEDRFADAAFEEEEDDYGDHTSYSHQHSRSNQFAPQVGESSILYDDDGVLDYAMDNDLLDSHFDAAPDNHESASSSQLDSLHRSRSDAEDALSTSIGSASLSDLPTVSMLGRSSIPRSLSASFSQSKLLERSEQSPSEPDILKDSIADQEETPMISKEVPTHSTSPLENNLVESQLFTHDDAESMYMSALSAAPHVPGGWDSSSTSSKSTASGQSSSIPDDMIAGSILAPLPELDDGSETPRPGTPQSPVSSNRNDGATSFPEEVSGIRKQLKTVLFIDEIVVWFPLGLDEQHSSNQLAESTLGSSSVKFESPKLGEDSIFAEMPGSFSNYASSSTHRRKPSMEASSRRRAISKPNQPSESTEQPATTKRSSPTIEIQVGSITCQMDISTGRIMYALFGRVILAASKMSDSDEIPNKADKVAENPSRQLLSLEISIKKVNVAWLENILAESLVEGKAASRSLLYDPLETIARMGLNGIHLSAQARTTEKRAKLQIGKFAFASLDQNIISFSTPRVNPKSASTAALGQLEHDIEIDMEQATDLRITIVTRPVAVVFDVQKLDEALSSFGGFSGMLELSNSISSGNTIQSPAVPSSPSRPRGVHFRDSPAPPPQPPATSSVSPKIQVQLGDVSFLLKGRTCSLKLQSTSVRMAVREGNVRLKVSEIKFDGPFIDDTQAGAPLMIVIKGTTVNFLFAPEEMDLTRLISMITPSKDPYENNDDILIDTLLRQRRKGSVLRVEISSIGVRVFDLQELKLFESIGADLARLSKVTKYLPDDDRPGLLSLASVQRFEAGIVINEQLGDLSVSLQDAAVAHVGVPALLALEVGQAILKRDDEILVHELTKLRPQHRLPAVMLRMVGDEMEPVVKAKIFNVCAEYRVSTVMAALGLSEDGTVDDIALGIAASVATITGGSTPKTLSRQSSQTSSPSALVAKPLQIDLLLRECAFGLNPHKIDSKGLFVLTDTHIAGKQVKSDYSIIVDLRKASVHAIDDVNRLDEIAEDLAPAATALTSRQSQDLSSLGYVLLSSISAAKIHVNIKGDGKDEPQQVDVEFRNDLFVLESCADSTQTLIGILNGLQPPSPPSTAERYRPTIPLQQMMESFTGDALLAPEEGEEDDFMSNADLVEDEVPHNLEFVGSIYNSQSLPTNEELGDSLLGEDDLGALATPPLVRQRGDRGLLESFAEQYEIGNDEEGFDFKDRYFEESDTDDPGKARKWDSAKNQYHLSNEFKVPEAPLKVRIRDVNVIWNLYDGYDWPRTRNIISQAVDDVEARAEERRKKAREEDEDDDFVEEDFLFNSVWIGVPVRDEKGALARRINHDIDDLASETGSYATSTATRSTGATTRPGSSQKSRRRLKLERSKHKKIAFSLMGVELDLIVFPPNSGETINSLNVRVRDFEIFDHVPTSTWKKFVTCLIEPHARQLRKPMINLEVVTVKPVTDLAASELVVKVTVLPLRLHVDQDALDFITRFFEFKDDTAPANASTADQPFIQRLEVQAVTLKLDYKPKRVDYRGLRSGHTTEFMNFLILDGSDIVLRHAIVYGLTSFDKVHKTLNDVWMPDVQRNQLPGVLSGLAAVRPIVNVGSGVRDLVVVPMREYKKDGRVVRSLQKGVYAFAKNTTSEVARLGAKVAIGTQNLLEGAETFLHPQAGSPSRGAHHDWDGEDPSNSPPEETRAVSHYANQPLGVKAGLRSAARHLERDLLTARDAVIAIPAEVMEEGSGVGVAKALARHAPTVILRPALGATKALSNALLGVGNALDDGSRRKIEDKYKSY